MGEVLDWGMRIPFAAPQMGQNELNAIRRVLSQSRLTEGPETVRFEEEFRDHIKGGIAIAVTSCTAALHLAWLALGIKGKKVIVPALTHAATAHAVEAAGGIPVFCDVDQYGNVTAEHIKPLIDGETGGICVVHFLGQPCPMADIQSLARDHNLPIVEDCALALGTTYGNRHVGLLGSAGCFSFYPAKHITTGEGGMLVTNDARIARRARRMRVFGRITDPEFDIVSFGLNFRMSEIAAAIGICQLERFPAWLETRRRNASFLLRALGPRAIGGHYAVSYVCETVREQSRLDSTLKRQNIETSRYYPVIVPHLAYYRKRAPDARFPNAERISARSVTLPVGPHITDKHLEIMTRTIQG